MRSGCGSREQLLSNQSGPRGHTRGENLVPWASNCLFKSGARLPMGRICSSRAPYTSLLDAIRSQGVIAGLADCWLLGFLAGAAAPKPLQPTQAVGSLRSVGKQLP